MTRGLGKSTAVLPSDNFSADQENAYFADGIQDDILTNLARIGELKVISRASVVPDREQAHNVREIGKALKRKDDPRRKCAARGRFAADAAVARELAGKRRPESQD